MSQTLITTQANPFTTTGNTCTNPNPKRLITVQTIISGHMTGIITQTKESETVHFNTEMLDSNDSNDFQMCIHFSISNYT